MRSHRFFWTRIFPACILLICIILGFTTYLNVNRRMTVDWNAGYVGEATIQTAKRINDQLVAAEDSISAIAHLYEQTMDPDRIDLETLEMLTENTPFDYMGIVGTDGIYTDNCGNRTSVSDRDYFKDGMQGNVGMDVVFNSRITHENLVIFYAPLRHEGEIIGLLTGRYREYQMRNIIATTFFGEQARTYLCLPDGKVIVSSNEEEQVENIIAMFRERADVDIEALEKLGSALRDSSSCSFSFESFSGTGAAYLTKLPKNDLMLLQTFPVKVTNEMLNASNSAAMYLELWLVALFVCYIFVLMLENRREKTKLRTEKQEMRDIVESTSQLFSRFIIADLKNNTYEYFKNDDSFSALQLPSRGVYTDLLDFWARHFPADCDGTVENMFTAGYLQEHLPEDIPYLQYEYQIREESLRWKQISVLCLKREEKIPVSVLMAVQDVTELKEAELRSRTAIEEACHAAQAANEAKRTFLFNMSHDMRTPMNAIIGYSTLLDRDAGQPEKVREYSRKIGASGRNLLELINDVLDMSKIESGKTTLDIAEFSLSELLEELRTILRPQVKEKEQSLDVRCRDVEADHLLGDKRRLGHVLTNLLSNAVKYTPRGGCIELEVCGLPQISAGYARLCFRVTDNGIGMSPEFTAHIFDPFTREHNTTVSGVQGTGLGMTIVKNLVDLMGGTISVESVQGEGSTFRVELELRYCEEKNPTVQEPKTSCQEEGSMFSGLQLLVVEDNDINAEILIELLSYEGMSCDRAVNGREAVECFTGKAPDFYDAVLMDIQMPEMNGYEAARAIRDLPRSDAKKVPIVAMTANAFAEDVQKALEAGMNAHIAKPIDMEVLLGALKRLLFTCT